MSVTLAQIQAHEAEKEQIEEFLDALGREICDARGRSVPEVSRPTLWGCYHFDGFSLYGGGITVTWSWSTQGGDETHHVSFPISYLDEGCDWRAIEAANKSKVEEAAELAEERKMRALV